MATKLKPTDRKIKDRSLSGFNVMELMAVLATLAILFCLVLPVMAKARMKSTGSGCLNNFRQMMIGWAAFAVENNDTMVPNGPVSAVSTNAWVSGLYAEDWYSASANTNRSNYLTALFAPYIGNRIELYRCPGDVIPSANGFRLRSCSMNGNMGALYYTGTLQDGAYNSGWRVYTKVSDLTCPTPGSAFIFADESMYTINDGFMQMGLSSAVFPDCPASYHNGSGSFAFADGHAELHHWVEAGTSFIGVRNAPYRYGVTGNNWPGVGINDRDWTWLKNRTSCKAN